MIQPTFSGEPKAPLQVTHELEKFYLQNLMNVEVMDVARVLSNMAINDEYQLFVAQNGPLLSFMFVDRSEGTNIPFVIRDMSHRAKLLTGFYDTKLPIISESFTIESPSVPYVYHGNKLYLVSNQGNAIHSSNVQFPSVLFRINEFLMSTLPVLIKPREEERDVVIGDGGSLREIELKLVDRWYEPVKIRNPMIVTIKMEPIMEEQW
jgi:hypothetical protein